MQQTARVQVPPIKCQGIKTKLVNFFYGNVSWNGHGRWIEPFLGSGVVLFNVAPERALVSDTNKHIINLYRSIQSGDLTAALVREFLSEEGQRLTSFFSIDPVSTDRFASAYITKIVNQVQLSSDIMRGEDWEFVCCDWRETFAQCQPGDFVYLNPPYVGRHTDYFNSWSKEDAVDLAEMANELPCGFALSMWKENQYRRNEHLDLYWNDLVSRSISHFYYVGSIEKLRNETWDNRLNIS